jgi:hypothetical protein
VPGTGRPRARSAAGVRRRAGGTAAGSGVGRPDDVDRGQHRRRPTPTGFSPADRLLAAIDAEPERSLDGWLAERRIGLRDVVEANVASGRWERRPGLLGLLARYTDLYPEQTARDLARSASDWPADASPADACVTVVAGASGLLDPEFDLPVAPPPALLTATGPAVWLGPTVVEHLRQAHARYRDEAGALGGGIVAPF